jgi:hypothetical protein
VLRASCSNRAATFGEAPSALDDTCSADRCRYKERYMCFVAVSTSTNDGMRRKLCAFEYFAAMVTTCKHVSLHTYIADTPSFAEVETAI